MLVQCAPVKKKKNISAPPACPNNPNIPPGTNCGPPPNVPYGGVCGGTPTCDPTNGGIGLSCSIDGAAASCSMAFGLLQGDAAVRCPYDQCSCTATDANGNTVLVQFYAFA